MPEQASPRIAYFSMEIAVDPRLPTYAGGLGMLASDMLRSAADFGLSLSASIALNSSFFNTQRMVSQYLINAYLPQEAHGREVAQAIRS